MRTPRCGPSASGPTSASTTGKQLTGRDVAYSLRITADQEQSPNFAGRFTDFDFDRLRVIDDRTVEVALMVPRGDFVEAILAPSSFVYPDGLTDFDKGVGTVTKNTPVEALERAYPMRVVRCRLRRGSGGRGEAPGGDGIERDLEMLEDCT